MTDDIRDLAEFDLPYSRRAQLREVEYDGGMKMLRLILREGKRITQVELDTATARQLADAFNGWADSAE